TAVAAVKLGAVDYLSKPADADDIEAALRAPDGEAPPPPDRPMSADRVRWEHIQRVYELCDRNVSETARRLNMHRRTLQRILAKRSPKE
ncbi:MAG: helix-turn-helix domain-containing protein, partial [Alphaproteobacteria bacterium]|nr:helix-turn-helix domain-containing protein [Alphaproteobacteria bacterium]